MSFATSNGLVFNIDKLGIPSNLLKYGGGSLQFGTVDLDVKKNIENVVFLVWVIDYIFIFHKF